MTEWVTDLRQAWRALRRTPGFLITCVVTLGLAIGAVAGMFNVVNTVILSFTMLTLSVVSGLALILGAVGLYGRAGWTRSSRCGATDLAR